MSENSPGLRANMKKAYENSALFGQPVKNEGGSESITKAALFHSVLWKKIHTSESHRPSDETSHGSSWHQPSCCISHRKPVHGTGALIST